MGQSVRSIPASYPQPLGSSMLKAEAQRQLSTLRQEVATDLLSILKDVREPNVRNRMIRVIEAQLKAGLMAAQRAENLWPDLDSVKTTIEAKTDAKPAAARKHLQLFERFDRVHKRSLALLAESFQHIRVIIDRVQPPAGMAPAEAVPVKR